jgi:hypothetical protein
MTAATVVVLAIVTMGIAAVRSTWSPCSLSMLSTVTPIGEASRGHRYPATAASFIGGAVLGGATLGALMAGLAALVGAVSPSDRAVAIAVIVASIVTIASDVRLGGFSLPKIARQVNETWLDRYRGGVYGVGFGWQIGVGLSTYVMTAAVYLMIVLGALTARPLVALALGSGFGLFRGLALLLGARLRTPLAIRVMHARFEAVAAWSLGAAVVGQLGVLTVGVLAVSGGVTAALCAAGAAGGVGLLALARLPASRQKLQFHAQGANR